MISILLVNTYDILILNMSKKYCDESLHIQKRLGSEPWLSFSFESSRFLDLVQSALRMLSDSLYEAKFNHSEILQVLRSQVQRMGNELPLGMILRFYLILRCSSSEILMPHMLNY